MERCVKRHCDQLNLDAVLMVTERHSDQIKKNHVFSIEDSSDLSLLHDTCRTSKLTLN